MIIDDLLAERIHNNARADIKSGQFFNFDNSDLGMEFGRGLVNNFVKYSLCPTLPAKFRLGVRREGGVVWLCCVTSVK